MDKGSHGRKDRLIKEKLHNVYRERDKSLETTVCPECGALYMNGRWSWEQPPEQAHETTCPACRRIADRYPAGHIELKGSFFTEHRSEILSLVQNVEQKEKEARPLERIMAIENNQDTSLVTTTGIHVARRIGEALARAYKGDLSFQYAEAEKRIRVYWKR
ncbi:MAG: BCAM0308 family protein [Chloroflexota bacterium]